MEGLVIACYGKVGWPGIEFADGACDERKRNRKYHFVIEHVCMKLTKKDVKVGVNALKRKAVKLFRKGDVYEAMHYLNVCSVIMGQFNFQYADDDIELLLRRIAEKSIRQSDAFRPQSNHWVLYDDFCSTYVLGLQWLEAMALSGRQLLYVTTRDINAESRHKNILDRVAEYKNVKMEIIPQGNAFKRAQALYDAIVRFNASKVVLHKAPTGSVMDLVLPILPKDIDSYVINLSDQTFWLGARSVDYCLEFRQFGVSVSLQRRGLKREQLLMVPFYPADDRNAFKGFPPECTDDKIVVFSGGDFYKTLDDSRMYWKLVREILNKYPQVVFLFATKNIPEGDREIYRFIKDNRFEGRFIYINFRSDIFQVFAHCDIYMGTSPTSGSLMSQLAAINAKPILQYYEPGTPDDETEQAICINETFGISFHDEYGFMREADRLIVDLGYRRMQGERLQRAMMQHEQFNTLVLETLEANQTQIPIHEYVINYKRLDDRWYYLEKAGYIDTMPYLYGNLGFKDCLRYAPLLFLKKNNDRVQKKLRREL